MEENSISPRAHLLFSIYLVTAFDIIKPVIIRAMANIFLEKPEYFILNCISVLSTSIAVITGEPADKVSFVYNRMQTRLRVKTIENDPLTSFV